MQRVILAVVRRDVLAEPVHATAEQANPGRHPLDDVGQLRRQPLELV
jgi:hypothetical protein